MKKPILIAIASLALLAGYSGKNDAVAASPNAVAAPTQASASQPPGEAKPQVGVPNLATGEKVYKSTCSICHKSGLRGAPRMGRSQDWGTRLEQDRKILYDHAINGFRGKKGNMPSRGSNTKLSEEEVKASVDYMIEHAVPSWTMEK